MVQKVRIIKSYVPVFGGKVYGELVTESTPIATRRVHVSRQMIERKKHLNELRELARQINPLMYAHLFSHDKLDYGKIIVKVG